MLRCAPLYPYPYPYPYPCPYRAHNATLDA